MPTDGPLQIHLGDHRRLGPDPEPLGERFDVLMAREHPTHYGCHRSHPGNVAGRRDPAGAPRELVLR